MSLLAPSSPVTLDDRVECIVADFPCLADHVKREAAWKATRLLLRDPLMTNDAVLSVLHRQINPIADYNLENE